MPAAKQDKYDILATAIDAIYDMNKKVIVETLNDGDYSSKPIMPTKAGKNRFVGPYSENAWYAQSIKIGRVSVQRIPTKNNGYKYMLRTPNGEAEFTNADKDFAQVWHAALRRYDIDNGMAKGANQNMFDVKEILYKQVKHNKKLADSAAQDLKYKDKKSKYEAAIEQLKQMGVQPSRLAKYIQDKQND